LQKRRIFISSSLSAKAYTWKMARDWKGKNKIKSKLEEGRSISKEDFWLILGMGLSFIELSLSV